MLRGQQGDRLRAIDPKADSVVVLDFALMDQLTRVPETAIARLFAGMTIGLPT